jgi:TolB-like protein/Flp pilus assembly protein TadD
MALSAGTRLGHYLIGSPLGAGGMGEVYRARDERLQRDVAIKVLPEAVAADSARLDRFEREALALARLSHPAILSIFDFGRSGSISYAVTELLEGETLRELLGRERVPWRRAVEIAEAVAEGLASAHRAGVIHRDLKPENIFLIADGRVKILDFGLARIAPAFSDGGTTLPLGSNGTQPGTVLGTVGYMAPEQVRGESAGAPSDIFALGCILYELLTGRRAFKRDTAADTMTAILRDTPPETDLAIPEASSELGRIVRRCLEKNPEGRFQSACDLAFNLREAIKPAGVDARPHGPALRLRRAFWIIPLVLLAAVSVLLWRWPSRAARSDPLRPPPRERVAVLPFENLGAEDDAYFVSGVADEIMGRLAAAPGLAVVSRASTTHYAGTNKPPRQIGDELGVKYLLTGTVRWAREQGEADRVRITPQLVQAADGISLWTEIYEFTMDDIFRVQSEIARAVVSHLGLTLLERDASAPEARPTGDMEAYQAFLRGRFLTHQPHFTLSTWLAAVSDFERAVGRDPGFGLAWAELAKAHARLVYFRYDLTPARRERARKALDRARALAPSSPEASLAAGYYHLWAERDPAAALAEFEKAGQGLPNSAEVQAALGELYRLKNDWARALEAFRAASALSPRDGAAVVDVVETLWWMRLYREALGLSDRAISLAPDQAWPYLAKAFTLWSWKGRDSVAESRAALSLLPLEHEWAEWSWFYQEVLEGNNEEALSRMDKDPKGWIRIKIQAAPKALFAAVLRTSMGRTSKAREGFETARSMLEDMVRESPEDPRYRSSLGVALAGLGRREEALREGRRGVELLPLSKDSVYSLPHILELAYIHALLGENEAAVKQIRILLSRPGWISVPWLEGDPRWRILRADPGFEALLSEYRPKS